jgi:FixJ family two-component response regulator
MTDAILRRPVQRVLLVDHDESLRRALARGMRRAGFEVDAYASMESLPATQVLTGATCLVLDIDQPGFGGVELGRARTAAGRALPTVFITSAGQDEADAQLARFDPVAVLHKPFDTQALIDALGHAFGLN